MSGQRDPSAIGPIDSPERTEAARSRGQVAVQQRDAVGARIVEARSGGADQAKMSELRAEYHARDREQSEAFREVREAEARGMYVAPEHRDRSMDEIERRERMAAEVEGRNVVLYSGHHPDGTSNRDRAAAHCFEHAGAPELDAGAPLSAEERARFDEYRSWAATPGSRDETDPATIEERHAFLRDPAVQKGLDHYAVHQNHRDPSAPFVMIDGTTEGRALAREQAAEGMSREESNQRWSELSHEYTATWSERNPGRSGVAYMDGAERSRTFNATEAQTLQDRGHDRVFESNVSPDTWKASDDRRREAKSLEAAAGKERAQRERAAERSGRGRSTDESQRKQAAEQRSERRRSAERSKERAGHGEPNR